MYTRSIVNQFLALGLHMKLIIAGVALIIIGSILQAIGGKADGEAREVRHVHGAIRRSWARRRNAASAGTGSVHRNA